MTNFVNPPLQNAYETELENSMTATQTDMVLADAPDFVLPVGQNVYAVIDPKNSFREVVLITALTGATATITRGQADYKGGASTATTHSGGATVIITDSFQIFDELATAVNSKLDATGGNAGTVFDLDLTGSAFRIRKDGTDMKFTDDSQSEVSLSTLAAAAGVDDKTKVSVTDTTAGYLDSKITVSSSGSITATKSITNPGVNEVLNIDIVNTASDAVVDIPYTAAEDIAIGYPVSKTTTADTVENTIVSTLADAGTEATIDSVNVNTVKSAYLSDNLVAVFYYDSGGAGTMKTKAVSISTNKVQTPGTAVNVATTGGGACVDMVALDATRTFNLYVASGTLYGIVATFNGTAIPILGSPVSFGTVADTGGYAACGLLGTDKVLVAYRQTSDSKGYAKAATIALDVVGTPGSAVELLTTGAGHAVLGLSVCNMNTDKAFVALNDVTDSDIVKGVYVAATGTALAVATEVNAPYTTGTQGVTRCAQLSAGKVILIYRSVSGNCHSAIATESGLTFTFGVDVVVPPFSDNNYFDVVGISSSLAYGVTSAVATALVTVIRMPVGATTVTQASVTQQASTSTGTYVSISKVDGAREKVIVFYRDTADSNKLNAEVYQKYDNSASLVGFTTSTVSSGASVDARSKGVIGSQTSLVVGTTYYLNSPTSTATLSSTNTTGIKVGVAKNTTDLDIDIDLDNGLSKTEADTLTDGSNADTLHTHVTSASGLQATGTISSNGNTDITITTGFQPTTIELDWEYVVPGSNTGYYYGKMIFNGTTAKYNQAIAWSGVAGVTWSAVGFPAVAEIGSNYSLVSDSTDHWNVVVSVLSVSATGFVVRLNAVKTNSPSNFATSFGWIAYK